MRCHIHYKSHMIEHTNTCGCSTQPCVVACSGLRPLWRSRTFQTTHGNPPNVWLIDWNSNPCFQAVEMCKDEARTQLYLVECSDAPPLTLTMSGK
jgi:hypothetical protein